MDTHRVKVFDAADDDAVVVSVAHNFKLILFPADQRFIDQQFFCRRKVETATTDFFELFLVVSNTTAATTQRK